MPVFVLMKA